MGRFFIGAALFGKNYRIELGQGNRMGETRDGKHSAEIGGHMTHLIHFGEVADNARTGLVTFTKEDCGAHVEQFLGAKSGKQNDVHDLRSFWLICFRLATR